MVSGGPGTPCRPGTTVGACSARRRCRAPSSGWLRRQSPRGAWWRRCRAVHAASAGPPDPTQPLTLRMSSITPDYIPDRGPIIIRGTVTNDSDEEWTAINVEGFVGSEPITTTAELAAAAEATGHRRRRSPDRGARHLRHRRHPAARRDGGLHGEAAALEDQDLGPRRLLVRCPCPGRDRFRAQRQRRGARPHVPAPGPARRRQPSGRADLPGPPGPCGRDPRPRRLHPGCRPVADQPAVRRPARRGHDRERRPGTTAVLGGRPLRRRRRTPPRAGQPSADLGHSHDPEPGREPLAQPVRRRQRVRARPTRRATTRRPPPPR